MKAFVLIAVALVACGKSDAPNPLVAATNAAVGGSTASNSARDVLIASWKKAGLDTSAFAAAQSPVGKDCQAGTVNKIDVLVCAFDSADQATAAQAAGLKWIGDTTGSAQAKGQLVIAIADRHKADPNGRTINQMMKAAQ